ncbi:hypothetical protein MMC25_001492 [Agyrium rufum]|nr:hypothetical protein [Agyrium rufum]
MPSSSSSPAPKSATSLLSTQRSDLNGKNGNFSSGQGGNALNSSSNNNHQRKSSLKSGGRTYNFPRPTLGQARAVSIDSGGGSGLTASTTTITPVAGPYKLAPRAFSVGSVRSNSHNSTSTATDDAQSISRSGPSSSLPPAQQIVVVPQKLQTYVAMPGNKKALRESLKSPKDMRAQVVPGQPDTSKWGMRFNKKIKPSLTPRLSTSGKGFFGGSRDSQSRTTASPSAESPQQTYTLQPIAYNPKPKLTEEAQEDTRQSWKEGDDTEGLNSANVSTDDVSKDMPPTIQEESEDEEEGEEGAVGGENDEEDTQSRDMFDSTDSESEEDSEEEEERRRQSVQRLNLPPPQLPPLRFEWMTDEENEDNEISHLTVEPNGTGDPRTPTTARGLTPQPPTSSQGSSSTGTDGKPSDLGGSSIASSTNVASITKSDELAKDADPQTPKPDLKLQSPNPKGPDGQGQDADSSFFWPNSPQSSDGETRPNSKISAKKEEEKAETVNTKVEPEKNEPAPKPSTNFGMRAGFSAAAWGFGGPSDWEHFGDYDGEEIDDTDLYVRKDDDKDSKPKSIEEDENKPDSPAKESSEPIVEDERPMPPTTEERPMSLTSEDPDQEIILPRLSSVMHILEESLAGRNGIRDSKNESLADSQTPGTSLLEQTDRSSSGSSEVQTPVHPPSEHGSQVALPAINEQVEKVDAKEADSPSEDCNDEEFRPQPLRIDESRRATPSPQPDDAPKDETPIIEDVILAVDAREVELPKPTSSPLRENHLVTEEHTIDRSAQSTPNKQVEDTNLLGGEQKTNESALSSGGRSRVESWMRDEDSDDTDDEQEKSLKGDAVTRESTDNEDEARTPIADPIRKFRPPPSQQLSPERPGLYRQDTVQSVMSGDDNGETIIISLQVSAPSEDTEMNSNRLRERLQSKGQIAPPTVETPVIQTNNLLNPTLSREPDNDRQIRKSFMSTTFELDDPYAGLDPWAKASLNRYVKMLHVEADEQDDKEKFSMFMTFMEQEKRLRAVLYDVDDHSSIAEDEPVIEEVAKRVPLKASDSNITLRTAGNQTKTKNSKPLPTLPQGNERARTASKALVSGSKEDLRGESSRSPAAGGPPKKPQLKTNGIGHDGARVDSPATEQTSGDKTVTHKGSRGETESPLRVTPSLTSLRQALDKVASQASASFGQDSSGGTSAEAALIAESFKAATRMPGTEPPRSNSVPVKTSGAGETPAEATLRREGKPYEGDKATNRHTIYRPFSMSLRPGSIVESTTNEETPTTPSSSNLYRHHSRLSSAASSTKYRSSRKPRSIPEIPPNLRESLLGPLFEVIPQSKILYAESQAIVNLRADIETVPDDFSFIHQAVLAWDADAKKTREKYDRERNARQTASEQRIDALFHEQEIGYGDISELEAEFKRAEAAKKAEEDRAEYQTFVEQVFNIVWERLHREMFALTPSYEAAVNQVQESLAGREMFEGPDERVPVAPAMECLLVLYQKLAVRHQKAFEAVLERDRRLKKTEVAPWYALGNISQVKKLKARFEDAEKKAILEFCEQRDARANLLMDVLDQNTLRGVGSNQDYMESVHQAVHKIAKDVARGAVPPSAVISDDQILKGRTITTALARSSEQIVQTFHVADMLLNAADYEVSVANARMSNASAADFEKLRQAKQKEDQKLVNDLEHRLSLIRGDTRRTHEEVTRLLVLLGKEAPPPGGLGCDDDNSINGVGAMAQAMPGGGPRRSMSAPVGPEYERMVEVDVDKISKRGMENPI